MKNIVTIALLELKNKKKSFSPKAIALVCVVICIFVASFFLLASQSTQVIKIYSVNTTDETLISYFEQSAFKADPYAKITINRVNENTYSVATDNSFEAYATQIALVEWIKKKNREKVSNESPSDIFFLSLVQRQREEILQPNFSNDAAVVTEDNVTATNMTNRSIEQIQQTTPAKDTVENVNNTLDAPLTSDITVSTDEPVGESEQNITIVEEIVSLQTDLVNPQDVSTIQKVKEMFLIIQIMIICNFFAALVGNSFFNEKINYKSSLLFTTTLKKREFFIGKMLPYALACLGLLIIIIFAQYPHMLLNIQTYIICFACMLTYFSLSTTNGLLARSSKEFSFLNVFTTSFLTLYLLIPAFIANFSTLGYASLVTPLLFIAQQQTVDVAITFFVLSVYLAISFAIFTVSANIFNFEYLYKYISPLEKIKYMLEKSTKRAWTHIVYGACVVPFIWIIQLFLISLFLVVETPIKTAILLLCAALSEELFRNFIVQANPDAKDKWKRSVYTALGFTIVEKGLLFVTIAPYIEGFLLIATSGILIPFGLHTLFTYMCYRLQKIPYFWRCLLLAIIHAGINFAIITLLGVQII